MLCFLRLRGFRVIKILENVWIVTWHVRVQIIYTTKFLYIQILHLYRNLIVQIEPGSEQRTPASLRWVQSCLPQPPWEQSVIDDSVPLQVTSSAKPSCRQTTSASIISHESSHTVPQILLCNTSMRPSLEEPTRRTEKHVFWRTI